MKKIDKFFNNSKIRINENHKEMVKNKILAGINYEKEKIPLFRNLNFYFGMAGMFIVVILSGITLKYFIVNKQNILQKSDIAVNELKYYAKDKINNQEIKKNTLDKKNVREELNNKTEVKEKFRKEKNNLNSQEGEILLSYVNEKASVESNDYNKINQNFDQKKTETEIKNDEVNNIEENKNFTKTSDSYKQSENKEGMTKPESERDERNLSKNKTIKKSDDLLTSNVYNTAVIIPNTKSELFDFKFNDFKIINTQEIINYLTLEYNTDNNNIYTEAVNDDKKNIFMLVYFKPENKVKNLKITLLFNYGINFEVIGYNEKSKSDNINDYYTDKSIKLLIQLKNNDASLKNPGNLKIEYYDLKNNKIELNKNLFYETVNSINNSSKLFKMTYLGYLIGEYLKNKISKDEVVIFKKNNIDNKSDLFTKQQNKFINDLLDPK